MNQYFNAPNSYPTCKSNVSYLHFDGEPSTAKRNLFVSNDACVEHGTYEVDSVFTGDELVGQIRYYEGFGWNVAGFTLYKENWLEYADTGGPYPEDRRIISTKEIADIRAAIKNANPPVNCKDTVQIINLMGGRTWGEHHGDSWFQLTDEIKEHLKLFDGVGTECHIGDFETPPSDGPNTLKATAAMAKWAQENNKRVYVFMGGAAGTYEDMPRAQKTYHQLWADMAEAGVDYKSDHLIYFRQGARDGLHTPENATNTLTHQIKWVIDCVQNHLPAIRAIASQTVAQKGSSGPIPCTLGPELVADYAPAVLTAESSNSGLLPNANISFAGSGANRTVTLTPVSGQLGTSTITLTAKVGPFSAQQTFTVTVVAPSLVTAVLDGAINDAATWGQTPPGAGDRNVWQTGTHDLRMATGTETFNGDTFIVQSGGRFAPQVATANLTLNRLVLDGGEIFMGNNVGLTFDLGGKEFTLNSGSLRSGLTSGRTIKIKNAALTGSGTVNINGSDSNGAFVEFQSTIDTTGFSGVFNVNDNGVLNLSPIAPAKASFGLSLSGTGKYLNDAAVAVTSLTIDGIPIPNGTYAYADFTPAQQALIGNNGGTITVLANTPPTLGDVSDQWINEDTASAALAFTVSDDLVTADDLAVSAFSSNATLVPDANIVLGGSGFNRTLTVLPATNQNGSATISIRVSDGVFTVSKNFNLMVGPMNDAPEMSAIENQLSDGTLGPVTLPFTIRDAETAAIGLTLGKASSNPALVPVNNVVFGGSGTNRTVTVTPLANQSGSATISLTVGDGAITTTNTFVFAIAPVDGPIMAIQSGQITDGAQWSIGMGPLTNDTHVWKSSAQVLNMGGNKFLIFSAESLEVQTGGQLRADTADALLVLRNLTLSGGLIYMGDNSGFKFDLSGHTFTLNSGTLKSGGSLRQDVSFSLGSLAGSGRIDIIGVNTNGSKIDFEDSIGTSGFTGVFDVHDYGILRLPPIPTNQASCGLVLSGTGKYDNDENIAVRSLIINGVSFPKGTYTYSSFTTAQKAFLLNNGGNITVVPGLAISIVDDQATPENIATPPIPFTVSKPGVDPNALLVSGSSSNPTLLPNANLLFGGNGSNRTVTLMPAHNQTGTTLISLVVSHAGESLTNTFQLTVTPQPQTFTAVTNGSLDATNTWGGPIPVPGDINIWLSGSYSLNLRSNATQTFFGDTLVIQPNGQLIPAIAAANLTLNNLILDGGLISMNNNIGFNLDFTGHQFLLNSGTLKSGAAGRDVRFKNGWLAGNGIINITGTDTSGSGVEFQSTMSTTNFTGLFVVASNGILNLAPISQASFAVAVSGTGRYANDANVALASLTIAGAAIPPGSYAYNDFTSAQKPFLVGTNGVITVLGLPNTTPALAAIANRALIAGQTLTITNVATDADVPAQILTFSLLTAPAGASINANNGILAWRPTINQSPSTHPFSVTVADNGSPGLSATQSFSVLVTQPVSPTISAPELSNGEFKFSVSGDQGPDYVVLASTNLSAWLPIWTNSHTPSFLFTDTQTTNSSQRFYRVLLGP